MEKITFDEFSDKFKVRRNPVQQVSPYDNTMLDLDIDELDYLESQDIHNVWTLTGDRGMVLQPGLGYRNVMGYFICKEKWEDNNKTYSLA